MAHRVRNGRAVPVIWQVTLPHPTRPGGALVHTLNTSERDPAEISALYLKNFGLDPVRLEMTHDDGVSRQSAVADRAA